MGPISLALITAFVSCLSGVVVDREVTVTGDLLRFTVDPKRGGAITQLELVAAPHNIAAGAGLLQEGFGVGSAYVPNRRLNESLNVIDEGAGRSRLVFSYEADGPNIRGLRIEKTIEALPDAASIRVTWRLTNAGTETHWVAPWVHNDVAPGGSVDANDRVDLASLRGIESPKSTGYWTASRNWIAVTDRAAKETVFAVYDAEDLHSFEVIRDTEEGRLGFKALFVPRAMAPGDVWQTTYTLGLVRGLSKVDFATGEFAAQLDYENGRLKFLMSAATTMPPAEFYVSILPGAGEPLHLPGKRFELAPDKLVRCTYNWRPDGDGPFDFLGQVRRRGSNILLGATTSSPHGGVDTRIPVGNATARFEPWTDAPFAVQRRARTLPRALVSNDDAEVWFESSLNKIFQDDRPRASGAPASAHRISLARNEEESFQVVLSPRKNDGLRRVDVRLHDLVDTRNANRLPASAISVRRVGFVPVRIGSHFENPTGLYPDPLFPFQPFDVQPNQSAPLWFTVATDATTSPGIYRGILEIFFANAQPFELWLEVRVRSFALPTKPALRTSIGFDPAKALRTFRAAGYSGSRDELLSAFQDTAARHRVTVQGLLPVPEPGSRFIPSLRKFEEAAKEIAGSHVTSLELSADFIQDPRQLEHLDRLIRARGLANIAYVAIAENPGPSDRTAAIQRMRQWSEIAPSIPMMISSSGLQPFFVDECAIWSAHSRIFDTPNRAALNKRIADGGEVWWHVDAGPPRPYANFFIDFSAVEHRALFWQAWALGIGGFRYANLSHVPPGHDAYDAPIVGAPVNGNGLLVYPSAHGPVDSIRWESIRDGIEDYDYLTLLAEKNATLRAQGGHQALVERAAAALDHSTLAPNLTNAPSLTTFSREAKDWETRRDTVADLIEEIDRVVR